MALRKKSHFFEECLLLECVPPPVALVRTDLSEDHIYSIIRVTRIDELGTTLQVTANVAPNSPILFTLKTEVRVPPKRRLQQEPHCAISQKTAFFTVTSVRTPNLT
jgi:hypothetical protein